MQRKLPRRKDVAQNDSAMSYFFDSFDDQKIAPKARSHDPKRKPIVLIAIWAALSLTGVAAAVAITVTGNSGSPGQVSLAVGKAPTVACDTQSGVNTDTISSWSNSYTDFTLQKVNLSNVDATCAGKTMTLVLYLNNSTSQSLTCSLPATIAASVTYSQATFTFATSSFATSSVNEWPCTSVTLIPTPVYMASLAGTAVQIL
jgi:mRNA-degrading endonuclease toxin of MazEF toxin-antitoxin module